MNERAEQFRELARRARARVQESWERSDTDGFLSQWAGDLAAREYDLQAEIEEAGGTALFRGLYEGDRRVIAKEFTKQFYGQTKVSWVLDDAEAERFGRRFIPAGEGSRIQKQLGLSERLERQAAKATVTGRGTGLSGSAWVTTVRVGDWWGRDAVLEVEE